MRDTIEVEELISDTFDCIVGLGSESIAGLTPAEVRSLKRAGLDFAKEELKNMSPKDIERLAEDLLTFAHVLLEAPILVRQNNKLE